MDKINNIEFKENFESISYELEDLYNYIKNITYNMEKYDLIVEEIKIKKRLNKIKERLNKIEKKFMRYID